MKQKIIEINEKYYNILIIFSFLILSLLSISLMIRTHQFMGFTDQAFHLKRILELKESILHGSWFPMFSFNQFHGSAIMTFYPYINLLPIAILSIFIKSKFTIVYIWFIINEFIALLCGYYGSYSFNKSKRISYVFSVIYGMSTFFLDLGINDFGETTSLAVLPLVIFGILNVIKLNKYIELSIGMTFIIFSHTLSALIAFIFVLLMCILNIKLLNIHNILNILKSFLLTILLTSIVWVPVIYFESINTSLMSTPAHPFGKLNALFVGSGIFDTIKNALLDNANGSIDFFVIIGIIISLVLYNHLARFSKQMLWISIFICFLCSDRFPWKILPHFLIKFLAIFQFTSRFYILPEILMSYVFSIIIVQFIKNKTINTLFICIIVILAIGLQFRNQYSLVQTRLANHVITKHYFDNHIKGTRNSFQPPYKIYQYRLSNQDQFKYPANLNYTASPHDYYPKASSNNYYNINNNYGEVNNHVLKFNHVGYNLFNFNAGHKKANRILVPIMDFNNNHLSLHIDHHGVTHGISNTKELIIHHISKGNHQLSVKYTPNILLSIVNIIMCTLGIAWLVMVCDKKFNDK